MKNSIKDGNCDICGKSLKEEKDKDIILNFCPNTGRLRGVFCSDCKAVEEYSIAIHEAGHVVMAAYLGYKIEKVIITPNEGKSRYKYREKKYGSKEYIKWVEDDICIGLSGFGATEQFRLRLHKNDDFMFEEIVAAEGDFEEAFKFCHTLQSLVSETNKSTLEEIFIRLWNKTVEIIKQPLVQQQIKAVTDALIKHKNLSGQKVMQIIANVEKVA